jgi:hypothetical protein
MPAAAPVGSVSIGSAAFATGLVVTPTSEHQARALLDYLRSE